MDLYIGGISFDCTEEDLKALFSAHGVVTRVTIVLSRDTGRPRGFAFCTMPDDAEAKAAMKAISGTTLHGLTLRVNESLTQRRD